MARVWEPCTDRLHGSKAPLDKSRCKASVTHGDRAPTFHQCSRKRWKDGWCKQHHPDSERERDERRQQKYQEHIRRLNAPYVKIRGLERKNAKLRVLIREMIKITDPMRPNDLITKTGSWRKRAIKEIGE